MPTTTFSKKWLTGLSSTKPDKLIEYTDSECKYLRVRVTPAGSVSLSVRKTPRYETNAVRRPLEVAIDDSLPTMKELRQKANALATEIDRGTGAKNGAITLQGALDQMLASSDIRPNTVAGYKRSVNHLKNYEHRPLTIWSAAKIVGEHRRIGKSDGAVAANNTMRGLRRILNHARAMGSDSPAWPTEELRVLKLWAPEKPRERRLEPEEFPPYWQAIKALEPVLWRDMVLMYMLTGMRRREVTELTTADIDWRKKTFSFDSKNRRRHTLPMTKAIEKILKRRREEASDGKLFPVSEPKNAFKHLNNATEVQLSPHDCRRTFAIVAEVSGVGGYVLKALLNHKPDANDVTARYVGAVDMPTMRDALARVERHMKKLVKG